MEKLTLALDEEAAALFAKHLYFSNLETVRSGEQYLVCDAGGEYINTH